jgi:hypothetical protein
VYCATPFASEKGTLTMADSPRIDFGGDDLSQHCKPTVSPLGHFAYDTLTGTLTLSCHAYESLTGS